MAKAQEELEKMFKTFASGFDDERLDKFIEDSERIMRRPAGLLLAQAGLDASTSKPITLLDLACGTGPIAAHLYETVDKQVLSQSKMLCADISENLVGTLKRRAEKNGWSNVETAVLDAQKSGLPEQSFSHMTLNFAMHIIPDPGAVLQDAMRILQPGGILAFTVWHKDNLGWVPDMRSSFATLPFEAPMPSTLPMAPNGASEFIDPDLIPEQLTRYGFEDVKVQTVEHTMRIENAEDYLRSFGMMRDWMLKSYWSEESKEKAKDVLDDHIIHHLTEKHNGQGWDLTWKLIMATCRKPRD
ncbi:S-adenosyl-L-methionine-dependent methyltransferase [Xylaria curta]|nr:S-adenosyl-L-methionine-dependent methyltransferase [Xylaria curta]